jgi:hypothetical protein
MHGVLYVCLPRSQARTSLQARKKVCKYLVREGFDLGLRFAGICDYFSVGGRWAGRLIFHRLRQQQPKQFDTFWKRYGRVKTDKQAEQLFRKSFPKYPGKSPFSLEADSDYGAPEDAQIMDESVYEQLKDGFGDSVSYTWELEEPNVIITDDSDDCEWPTTKEEAEKLWVVVIDYHF